MSRTKAGIAIPSGNDQFALPLGGMLYEAYQDGSLDDLPEALSGEGEKIRETLLEVWQNDPQAGFLHSMLCSMALPVREPADPTAPIVKQNGNTSLIIQPLQSQEMVDGELRMVCWGMPFGRFARIILYYVMTQAVYKRSRSIELGKNFSDWLRRMKIDNVRSGGKRGTRTLLAEQMRRIMSCQWTFRTDQVIDVAEKGKRKGRGPQIEQSLAAFSVQEMKVANRYAGLRSASGEFVTQFILSEEFFDHLVQHSVPLNDRAMAALQNSATQMDLYCWLSQRLPRIEKGKVARISWDGFLAQIGNEVDAKGKARQTIRRAWNVVSGAYPEARNSVNFGSKVISLAHAERPADGRLTVVRDREGEGGRDPGTLLLPGIETDPYADVTFPKTGGVHYHEPFASIGRAKGKNNCLIALADRFRKLVGEEIETLKGPRLVRRWERFCESVSAP